MWKIEGRVRLSGWLVHRGYNDRRERETEAVEDGRGRDAGIRGLLEPRAQVQMQQH